MLSQENRFVQIMAVLGCQCDDVIDADSFMHLATQGLIGEDNGSEGLKGSNSHEQGSGGTLLL